MLKSSGSIQGAMNSYPHTYDREVITFSADARCSEWKRLPDFRYGSKIPIFRHIELHGFTPTAGKKPSPWFR